MVDGSGGWLMMADEKNVIAFTSLPKNPRQPPILSFLVPKAMSWFEHVFSSGDFFVFGWLGMNFSQSWIYGR